MATEVTIDPGYSPHNTEIIEICSHCNRPFCPTCLNHSEILDKVTGLWVCSNPDCKHEFHHYILEDK